METECIFCKITSKKLAAAIVYEDENFLAFLDHHPWFLGHTLLIPKLHFVTLYDLPNNLSVKFITALKLIGNAVVKGTNSEGSLIINNNIISQSVPHFHVHIVPRIKGDGIKGFFWPRMRYKSQLEIETIQSNIQKNC